MTEGSGRYFEDTLVSLRKLTNDKNSDVRKAFYLVSYNLILNFNIVHLNKFECHLVIFLLNGLSDEKADVVEISKDYLEKAGSYRKVIYFFKFCRN